MALGLSPEGERSGRGGIIHDLFSLLYTCVLSTQCVPGSFRCQGYICAFVSLHGAQGTESINNVNKKIVYSMLESNKCSEKKLKRK